MRKIKMLILLFFSISISLLYVSCNKETQGPKGDTGNGIDTIIKTTSVGEVDTYTITYTNGLKTTFTVINGKDGISVVKSEINESGELVLTYSNGTSTNLGKVVGTNGTSGIDGKDGVGIETVKINDEGHLIVTLTTGVNINLGNIKGEQGIQGNDGVSVVSVRITENGELIFTLSNGDTINVGKIIGTDGIDGVGIKAIKFNESGELIITLTDNSEINCGKIPSCEHVFGDWTIISEANCTSLGVKVHICSKCGYEGYEFSKSLGHQYIDTIVNPTCTDEGYTLHSCTKCDYTYKDTYTSKLSHSFGSYTTMFTTCTNKILVHTCSMCGISEMKTESGNWHNYTTIVISPTCKEEGYTLHSCQNCGTSYKDTYITKIEHTWEDVCDVVSNCTKHEVLRICSLCGYTKTFTADIVHEYEDGKCKLCGKYEETSVEYFKFTEINDGKNYSISILRNNEKLPLYILIPDIYYGKEVTEIADSGFTSYSYDIHIKVPSSITKIGDWAFSGCRGLTTIIFEGDSKIQNIGKNAFKNCTSLTSIEIPNSVTSIGDWAFSYCSSITSIKISSSVTSIGLGVFNNCTSLISTELPNSVTSIGDSAFKNCTNLVKIEIPSSIIKIGSEAFYGCSNLISIELPKNLPNIGSCAFFNCNNLENIYYEGTIEDWYNISFTSIDSNPMKYANHFYIKNSNGEYEEVTEIEIPNTITSIGNYQFYGFNNVTKILIPDSVISIGLYAFVDCSITSIEIPSSVTSIGYSAFLGCSSLTSITLPFIGETKYKNTYFGYIFGGSSSYDNRYFDIKEVIILNGCTSIGYESFSDCNLTSITIPNTITSIGDSAFYGCRSLENVYYEGTIEDWCNISFSSIDSNPMYYANHFYIKNSNGEYQEVTEIEIPDTITKIGNYQFHGFTNDKIIIPNSVTSIGQCAFRECSSLKSLEIPNSVTSIGDWAFSYCSNLASITISTSVTNIGNSAFSGCSSVKKIILPIIEEIYIGYFFGADTPNSSAYYIPDTLTDISILGGSSNINNDLFNGCRNILNLELSSSVISIENIAFNDCESLENVYYDGTIEDWCNITFGSWSSNPMEYANHFYIKNSNGEYEEVTEIEIPDTITKIGDYQFWGFHNVTKIVIPNSVTEIGFWAIFGNGDILSIYCEVSSEPNCWNSSWNASHGASVIWDYKNNS